MDPFTMSITEQLEVANQTNWQEALRDVAVQLSVEHADNALTDDDKDRLCSLLLSRMVEAAKAGEISDEEVPGIASYISSHVAEMTVQGRMEDFLYLLSDRWPIFESIPSVLY